MYRFVRTVNIDGHLLEIDETGHYFRNAVTGIVYTVFVNKQRGHRETIFICNKMFYTSRIIAKAYPEICGVWFDGCEVHHIDRNKSNNTPYNLMVISKEDHQKEHNDELVKLSKDINSIPVHQYTLDGKYVQTFSSSQEAGRYFGKSMSAIRNCLCGISTTAFGYRWVHSPDPALFIEKIPTGAESFRISIGKKITNGEKEFNSIADAADYYKVGRTAINNCLKGRSQSCCGFKWRYLD